MCIYRTFIKSYGKINYDSKYGVVMTTVKVMSIIGIILFSIGFISIIGLTPANEYDLTVTEIDNMLAAMGLSIILIIYGLAYSITCLVQSNKHKKQDQSY